MTRSARRRNRLIGVVVLLLVVGLLPGTLRAAHEPVEQLVLPGPQSMLRSDGEWLVWVEGQAGRGDEQIDALQLSDRRVQTVVSGPGLRFVTGVDQGRLLVSECLDPEQGHDGPYCAHAFDLYVVELATGTRVDVGQTDGGAAISGDTVVWTVGSNDAPRTIMGRDIRTLADPFEIITRQVDYLFGPMLEGERLVWAEIDGNRVDDSQLLTMQVGDTEPTLLYEGDTRDWTYSDGTLALILYDDIIVIDIETSERRSVAPQADYTRVHSLTTDGEFLFWETSVETGDVHQRRSDIWGHDLSTGQTFPVIHDGGYNGGAIAKAGVLVWLHGFDDIQHGYPAGTDIVMAPIETLLPDRSHTPEDALVFAETGQVLQGKFRDAWEAAGGLMQLGMPVTAEVQVVNDGANVGNTFQWTERARMERHPEFAGTPYEVQLGHLGWEEVNRRLISYYDAFKPLSAFDSSPRNPSCRYFPETDHQLCGDFLAYWESHGLEFGDPGVSDRESLALFGYPISETFDDYYLGEVVTAQYFERTRLELHPDNPDPYKVLVSRFGAVMERWRGW